MTTKNIFFLSVLFTLAAAQDRWNPFLATTNSFQDFFDGQSTNMRAFFEGQREKMEKALNSSYESAMKMKETVNSYVGEQQKKIVDSGRKVADSWSFVSTEEPGARMQNPELTLSVPSLITSHGYTCETHTVISQGYVLNLHRIPRAKTGVSTPMKTVLLQHGLFASSADWILNGPDKALAYVLADAGYDVWMANMRGNRYSREHAWLKNDSKSYWNFSWHDVALHDIPAIIDYILKIKGSDAKITYIGHSMGTTILFAMLTLRPEYNNILSQGIALAPVVFMSEIKSPLKTLAPVASNVAYMEMLYGSHEFIPKNSALGRLSTSCDPNSSSDATVCKNVVFYLCGYNEKQFNKTLLPVFLSHLGTGTSWKTAVHFAQEVVADGKFQQFDYGAYNNEKVYGMQTPPEYDLSKVSLPISLFWAQNDLLSSEKDVMMLHDKLPKETTELYRVPDPEFNHIDYLWAVDAPTLLNNKLLETLQRSDRSLLNVVFKFGK